MSKKRKKQQTDEELLLGLREEHFCKLITSFNFDYHDNATQSYIKAYGIDISIAGKYDSARVLGHKLLTKVNIKKRIKELLDEQGFNDNNVTKQHLKVMNQDKDLSAKKGSLELYYKINGRIIDKHKIEDLPDILDAIEKRNSSK